MLHSACCISTHISPLQLVIASGAVKTSQRVANAVLNLQPHVNIWATNGAAYAATPKQGLHTTLERLETTVPPIHPQGQQLGRTQLAQLSVTWPVLMINPLLKFDLPAKRVCTSRRWHRAWHRAIPGREDSSFLCTPLSQVCYQTSLPLEGKQGSSRPQHSHRRLLVSSTASWQIFRQPMCTRQ